MHQHAYIMLIIYKQIIWTTTIHGIAKYRLVISSISWHVT